MSIRPFDVPGVWLRGNMHTHTTESDGLVTPQEAVKRFAEQGYDFLSLTDHERLTDTSGLDDRGLTLLPGTEVAVGANELGSSFHLVGIGLSEMPELVADDAVASLEALRAVSQYCFVAHPSWSNATFADLLPLAAANGIEVFNTGCQREMGRGTDEVRWDDCLARGVEFHAVAVDDCHWKIPDAFGGWVMVRAADRSPASIYAALQAGRFYSSTGPVIEEIEIEPGRAYVRCSPVAEVFAVCPLPGLGGASWRDGIFGRPITECEVTFSESARPIRIVVVDEHGNRAWSNPYRPDEEE
ncbi:MAG: hypothetical protein J7M38_12750 [Armatimonadetes bacterium]|nr:hypothetical protein [Armatimonadota bacterium]